MKRLFPLFSALAAVPFVALLLVSLGYTLGEASLLAVMFLPGLFAFRHFLPQIRFAERRRGALQLFYLTGAVLTFEYVALMLTNFYLRYNASVWRYDITMPDLLQNPLFILLLLAACALPMHWIELRCNTQPARDRYVEFISDRRRVRNGSPTSNPTIRRCGSTPRPANPYAPRPRFRSGSSSSTTASCASTAPISSTPTASQGTRPARWSSTDERSRFRANTATASARRSPKARRPPDLPVSWMHPSVFAFIRTAARIK